MITRFEEQQGRESTIRWGMQEGEGLAKDGDDVVVYEGEGTEGQQFRENLIDQLCAQRHL